MNETQLKTKFAELLLRSPGDSFAVANEIFPDNTNRALRVSCEWPEDPEVIEIRDALLEEKGEMAFLPTKADLCRDLWAKMNNRFTPFEDYIKGAKLYADVRGWIEKPQTNIQNNMLTAPRAPENPTSIIEAQQAYKDMIGGLN